ncbi:MAG: FHA domain-containing protein, partial [Gemmatimonadota bacterium]
MAAPQTPTPLLVFLAGSRRGEARELARDVIRIGVGADMDLRLPEDTEPLPGAHHATLRRRGTTYEMEATPGHDVWVNGEHVDHLVLASGDVLELGGDGAVVRYRLYPAGSRPQRRITEVFSDCVECATRATDTRVGRLGLMARQLPGELLTQTSPLFRATIAVLTFLVIGLGFTTWYLAQRTSDLEVRLAELTEGVVVSEIVERSEEAQLNAEVVTALLAELQSDLDAATGRLDSLQGQVGALGRAIQATARSTV